jgi:hypothetical protein
MLRQGKGVKPFCDGCLHNILQGVLRMSAELTRVTVVGVRHVEQKLWTLNSSHVDLTGVFRMLSSEVRCNQMGSGMLAPYDSSRQLSKVALLVVWHSLYKMRVMQSFGDIHDVSRSHCRLPRITVPPLRFPTPWNGKGCKASKNLLACE